MLRLVPTTRPIKLQIAFSTLVLFLAAAGSAAANPKTVCGSFSEDGQSAIKLEISTGCISSSFRYLGHDINASVSAEGDSIIVEGGFKYESPDSSIAKMDCGAHKKIRVALADVVPRRYKVLINGRGYGVIDFAKSAESQCVDTGKGRSGNAIKVRPNRAGTRLKLKPRAQD